jgi:hypothetical protein
MRATGGSKQMAHSKEAAVGHYEAAWNETDPMKRMSELELAWGDDAVYVDDDVADGLRGR